VDLFLVDTASGAATALNLGLPAVFGADWDLSGHVFSDDGQVIAYNLITSDPLFEPAGYYRVGLVNRDGTNQRLLPGPADHAINEGWPTFSPDGKWITTQRFAWNDPDGQKASLALLPSDGSAVGQDLLPAGVAGQSTFDVTWAPDSSRIFVWSAGPQVAYLIDPATGNRETLDWIHDVAAWQRRAP
jgi:Tol biopolymer transport system component